jgi:Uma2 family endonuclease
MPGIDRREEVVDGEIVRMPIPKWEHAEVVSQLQMVLIGQMDRRAVLVSASRPGLLIRKDLLTCRTADLAVMIRRNVKLEDGYVRSAPELVAEVLSADETRKDLARKIEHYEVLGVPEVWILSPEARTLEVLQLHDGKLRTTQIVNSGQLRPLRFPETVVDVASVWPD